MNYKKCFLPGSIFIVALFGIVVGAQAQMSTSGNNAHIIPFIINGEGDILGDILLAPGATAPHSSTGRGSAGLGHYQSIGAVRVIDPATGEFSSDVPHEFIKNGNGDVLAFHYGRTDPESGASPPAAEPGVVMVLPDGDQFITVWLAEFNPVPSACTGKFARVVSGSFLMLAISEPFDFGFTPEGVPYIPAGTAYSWSGRGTIEFE